MKLRILDSAGGRTSWRYCALLLVGPLVLVVPSACSKGGGAKPSCTGDVEEYQGRCFPHVTAKYLACVEGKGFSVRNEIGGSVTLPAVADSTFRVAYGHSKDEDSTVTLQIVHDCLTLAEKYATSGTDRGAARDYVQQTTRYIVVVRQRLPAIELAPSQALNCGSADVGAAPVSCPDVTIKSTGVAALDIRRIQMTGANSDDFKAGDECLGKSLDPGESCTMTVEFRPSATGERNANLTIHQNIPLPDQGTPLQLFGTGTGTQPPTGGHTLTVTVDASAMAGGVTSGPAGIDCRDTCTATFDDGTDVTLTATYDQGGGHVTWGDCDMLDGDNCIVHLTADRTITAQLSP
jgi:hypothetical protein